MTNVGWLLSFIIIGRMFLVCVFGRVCSEKS
jgi:hypothetical protein